MIAETTASFTGIELRATIVVGAALGLLAAARRIAAQEAGAHGATAATSASIE
jgi:hypothetical protein